MLSVGKIFWLIIILISVWYLFKIIEKRKLNTDNNSQNKENDNDNGREDTEDTGVQDLVDKEKG